LGSIAIEVQVLKSNNGATLSGRCRNSLKHLATNWKSAGSIPDSVIEFFIDVLPAALWHWGQLSP